MIWATFKKEYKKDYGNCNTEKIILSGGEFEGLAEIASYIEQQTGESKQIGGNFQLVSNLVFCIRSLTHIYVYKIDFY